MRKGAFTFKVFCDREAQVWFTESDEIKGVVAEAPTLEELHEKLLILIPEMLELNHSTSAGNVLPISLNTHREYQIA